MDDLTDLLERLRTHRPVAWEQLPDFSLYMDQVLSYMDRQVLRFDGDDGLTSAMVNNYTKSGLVPRAEGKKYNREHLAYLTVICILKQVLSSRDMSLLLQEELADGQGVKEGYERFCRSLDSALRLTAEEMDARSTEQGSLADAAIHFALLSYAASVASNRYVSLLRRQQDSGEPEKKPAQEKRARRKKENV